MAPGGTTRSRSCCSPRRADTARAWTVPCRRSNARSTPTARPCMCARRSSTTSTSSQRLRERGRDLRGRADRGAGGRAVRVLRPRRRPQRARRRAGAWPAHDRRHLSAGDQGPSRGRALRAGGLHDRARRPRGPRGGRRHDGRGARADRARGERGRRRRARRSRTPSGSPTSPRRRSRWTKPTRSSRACASASRRSSVPAPMTSATPRPTARRPSSSSRATAI